MNCLYLTSFFNVVAGIVQTFIKSWNQLLYPRVIEVCRLPFEPRHDFFLYFIIIVTILVTVAWIQECDEKPMFHLQSQISPETHLRPVSSAWETSAWNPSFSFCDCPLTFWAPSVCTIFCTLQFVCEFSLDFHLWHWEIIWPNAPRIWWDFGSALPFWTRLTQTKPFLPLSNEHGSQVRDQGRRQCCQNKHKKFPYRPTCDVSLLLDPPRKCLWLFQGNNCYANALNVMCIHTVSILL